ncbi:CCNJL protein, partial [Nyctibius bracteatus]|nr:CCNJL protein [Nyctibius bracteatus]
ELTMPMYTESSPQIGMRPYFIEFLSVVSNSCNLCPTARHLAVYLFDIVMDRCDITVKELQVVSLVCLLLASKFEDNQVKVPKLQYLNHLAHLCNVDVVLNKQDLRRIEKVLLENFQWNLCLPTAAHYIDYYLCASVGANDRHNGWPVASLAKIKPLLEKYAYFFLDLSLQDHTFLHFRPSVIAAASVCAARICMQVSPMWSKELELTTWYFWEDLAQCTEMMLMYYNYVVKEASNTNQQAIIQKQEHEAVGNLSHQPAAEVFFQQSSYKPLDQHSATFSLFRSPVPDLCSAYRDSLQAHRPSDLLAGSADSSLYSYTARPASLRPSVQTLPVQAPMAVQVP